MDPLRIVSLSVAGTVIALVYFVVKLLSSDEDQKLLARRLKQRREARVGERLDDGADPAAPRDTPSTPRSRIAVALQRLGLAAARPFMPTKRETQSKLRRQLGFAGIYSPASVRVMAGAKVLLLFGGLVAGYLVGEMTDQLVLAMSVGGLIGYVMPMMWLRMRIGRNQRDLNLSLPDALDLMVVCIEAGLTVDSAMQRVGTELSMAHPALSREFGIAHMETRVGLSRGEALKNLGQRTGTAGLQSLASMLIQAERFGTSIAQALRIHADTLRTTRHQQAEEMAAKASVKMSFPLVLFIFPAPFIVLAGPTVISLMNSSVMK